MFNVGDAVYHPINGAGIIANLQRMPTLKIGQEFYKIRMLASTKTTLLVPVGRAGELGLRLAATRDQVVDVLSLLASRPVDLPQEHRARYEMCEEKLDAADIMQTAEVVRDLSWRRIQHDTLNVPGRRIFMKAMALLAGELAVAQDVTLAEAEGQIDEILQRQTLVRETTVTQATDAG